MLQRRGSILTGSFLIAGTSIGAGMLALPFATGVAGFWPALVVSALSWLYMLFTGLLFLEVTLWMPDGSNVLSMTRRFLGPVGWFVGGLAFIFLYYCLLVAYLSAGTPLLIEVIHNLLGVQIVPAFALLLLTLLLALVVLLGHTVTGRINVILMGGMLISYIALIALGSQEIHIDLLRGGKWGLAWAAAPTLFTAYGYHNIIPSVSTYLKRDVAKLRWAVFIGTLIPFAVYTVWQLVMIGALPQEVIADALAAQESVTRPLELLLQSRWIAVTVRYFSLFAITTSVLGVGMSMVDFLGDGTKVPREGWGRVALILVVFIPPFLFAWHVPNVFFSALHYAGGFGEATLNGLIPALMVWVGRYRYRLKRAFWLPLGRGLLSFVIAIAIAIIVGEAVQLAGHRG